MRQSGSQLNKLHDIDTSLESLSYGLGSLTKDVSILSKISDYQLASASEEAQCIEEHKVSTAEKLDEVQEKVSDAKDTINSIESAVHPCGGNGWREIVDLDFSVATVPCRGEWQDTRRGCGRMSTMADSISMASFPVTGDPYNEVCGKIIAFSFSTPAAFLPFTIGMPQPKTLEDVYVDGVSVTHGMSGNRTHVWTFAASGMEEPGGNANLVCPCSDAAAPQSPDFVGNNFFCEAGVESGPLNELHGSDPLWDEGQCPECCEFNTPPYFNRFLPAPTSDPLDVRILLIDNQQSTGDDVSIEIIQLYVR